MGQAQLLLIVLGVVLVGIAIIAGIQAYDANNRKASVDALTHDAIRYASDIQLWAQKPEQFGGPENRGDASAATIEDLGYTATDGKIVNSNGECGFDFSGGDWSAGGTGVVKITCDNNPLGTQAVVDVTGLSDNDIEVFSTDLGS